MHKASALCFIRLIINFKSIEVCFYSHIIYSFNLIFVIYNNGQITCNVGIIPGHIYTFCETTAENIKAAYDKSYT